MSTCPKYFQDKTVYAFQDGWQSANGGEDITCVGGDRQHSPIYVHEGRCVALETYVEVGMEALPVDAAGWGVIDFADMWYLSQSNAASYLDNILGGKGFSFYELYLLNEGFSQTSKIYFEDKEFKVSDVQLHVGRPEHHIEGLTGGNGSVVFKHRLEGSPDDGDEFYLEFPVQIEALIEGDEKLVIKVPTSCSDAPFESELNGIACATDPIRASAVTEHVAGFTLYKALLGIDNLDMAKDFFFYKGGDTCLPCRRNVHHAVYMKPVSVNWGEIEPIKAVWPSWTHEYGNVRDYQVLLESTKVECVSPTEAPVTTEEVTTEAPCPGPVSAGRRIFGAAIIAAIFIFI